jgi:hypothetical protein
MATNIEPQVLMNSILGKISDVLLNGDGTVIPKSDDHYLAFMSPGIPLLPDTFNYAIEGFGGVVRKISEPGKLDESVGPQGPSPINPADMAADAARKYAAAEQFSALCDLVPDTSGIVDSGRINTWNPETRISHAYAMALQFSQVYNVEPDAATKANLERWRSLLQTTKKEQDLVTLEEVEVTRETDMVKRYREKMLNYLGEAMAYNAARVSALAAQDQQAIHNFAINGPVMQMRVRAAENDWIGNGFRDTLDRVNAAIAAVEGRSFALLKQRYRDDFSRSLLTSPATGANFSYAAPAPSDFARAGSGWSQFYFDNGSYRSNHQFKSSSTMGGGGLAIGPFLASGGGGVDSSNLNSKMNAETFTLKLELCRVPIYRPGINLAFLKSGFWRFDQQNEEYKSTLLSDGARPPKGLMPAITTDCIFVRNLEMNFGERNSELEVNSKKVYGGGTVAYGPFFLGGKHENTTQDSSYGATWSKQGLSIPGMQLIGFLCHTLEKCPDPNPNVPDGSWL